MNLSRLKGAALAAGLVGALGTAGAAQATTIKMPTVIKQLQDQRASHRAINPPAPPCPEYGQIPDPAGTGLVGACGLSEFPATGVPTLGNMSYWGGFVETHPKIYLVYWGWGEKNAFKGYGQCSREKFTEGAISTTLACDPEGAGRYMADFVHQMGGTHWAGVTSQYYETNPDGTTTNVSNDKHILAGTWVDDRNDITDLESTSATGKGEKNTYTRFAEEATRAMAHFGLTAADLHNANIVIAQPPAYSDPNALSSGYCAFHDYTLPDIEGGIYNGSTVQKNMAWTNMPYANAIQTGGANDCAENSVNSGEQGKHDAFSIVLGHEIEETVTDPGAEDVTGSYPNQTFYGGWYDPFDANENGDKCAYVGYNLVGVGPTLVPDEPGELGNITGSDGGTFAVQSTWDNNAAAGAGYCGGVNDLPAPLDGSVHAAKPAKLPARYAHERARRASRPA